jgi:hypothetical protein
MKRETAERLARLYPPAWRARFGVEFVDLLETEPLGLRVIWDIFRAATIERLFNLSDLETLPMVPYPADILILARRPSGFVPILMSLAALAVVILSLAITGPVRQHDEGAAAHVFQLLVVGELPVLALFLARWARKRLWASMTILALQAAALALALFPVWWFHL